MKTCILLALFFFACSCKQYKYSYPYRGVESRPKKEKEERAPLHDKQHYIPDKGYR